MQDPTQRLREEFINQCFCDDKFLDNPATLSCKYNKKEVSDWWLQRFEEYKQSLREGINDLKRKNTKAEVEGRNIYLDEVLNLLT